MLFQKKVDRAMDYAHETGGHDPEKNQEEREEDIRKEVYLPLDYGANFSFDNYKPEHFISNDTSDGKKEPSKSSTRMVACGRLPT